mmetsp:Transcript_31454/g.30797  ORF Transcript_31454/g.30797 Transcript_31454/m.30797 type:complete len:82 (+) Transcript_31454:1186-1431(+)
MQVGFTKVVHENMGNDIASKNVLEKEKKDAIDVAKYKEVFKMERLKREEERNGRIKDKELEKEEQRKLEKEQRKENERLKI